MRVKCLHGYFLFEDDITGDTSDFVSLFNLPLARAGDHLTFKDLVDAPEYSIENSPYLSATATKTFAGKPWEIMRANELVYNFDKGLVVPIGSITDVVEIYSAGNYFFSPGLILPGSLTDEGSRVIDYVARFSPETMRWKYSEVHVD